nr:bifunctional 5,10-methylenetetrahydrofolate dehydrogenase/5,10-methenyltetrahydrofolate cyclohydrolase [Candidatus Levybacteria bacterium]
MKIDGREISSQILEDLKQRVEKLKEKNVIPHLYIILLSDDPSSVSYVKQKMLRAREIGIKITLDKENPDISTKELLEKIEELNNDSSIHGIIVQRPMPKNLDEETIAKAIMPQKDVDGFNPNSKFDVPVALAILKMLNTIHPQNFNNWLIQQKICVIGKGITAGKPIINSLQKLGIKPLIIDSKTNNRNEILKNCEIIISAVGKPDIFKSSEIKDGAILIGVGLHGEDDGKFHGDFRENEIQNIASFYSPTPGGVGPVNVAMLLQNLVKASGAIDNHPKND